MTYYSVVIDRLRTNVDMTCSIKKTMWVVFQPKQRSNGYILSAFEN